MHNIIIVGGGAGGLELAARISKTLVVSGKVNLTLVDKSLKHIWKPLYHEVAAGTLDASHEAINYITYAIKNNFTFELGELKSIQRSKKQVTISNVVDDYQYEILPERTLTYDTLIIAVGSISNDFSIPGVKEHCLFLDVLSEAEYFHQILLHKILALLKNSNPAQKLNIAIIGGGATGVELAAELHYAINRSLNISNDQPAYFKITIIEAADRILSTLSNKLSSDVTKQLNSLGIDTLTNEKVISISQEGIQTNTGRFIEASIKVWAAGVKVEETLKQLDGLETNRINQLCVKKNLQTTLDESIYAFGDCASCPDKDGKWVPPRAQAAHQQAKVLAKTLQNILNHHQPLDYHYKDYGSLITISNKNVVGTLMGKIIGSYTIQGKLARLFYLMLYKMHETTLYGLWKTFLLSIARMITNRVKPRLKLH